MNNFKTALENVMQKDIERFENSAEHEFSAEFEKNMTELSRHVSGRKGQRCFRRPIRRTVHRPLRRYICLTVFPIIRSVSRTSTRTERLYRQCIFPLLGNRTTKAICVCHGTTSYICQRRYTFFRRPRKRLNLSIPIWNTLPTRR